MPDGWKLTMMENQKKKNPQTTELLHTDHWHFSVIKLAIAKFSHPKKEHFGKTGPISV